MTFDFEQLRGGVIVSSQAMDPRSPLRAPEHLVAMAVAAELGGAAGFRVEGAAVVAGLRARTARPIIGIRKVRLPGTEVYITPTVGDVHPLIDAGAEVVAADATARRGASAAGFSEIVAACHQRGVAVLADVATATEARGAVAAGADAVATTMAGLRNGVARPAVGLAAELVPDLGVPVIVEGGVWSPDEVTAALSAGAWAVVVGSAVTAPDLITARFVRAARLAGRPGPSATW